MKDLSDILILTDLDGTFFGPRAKLVKRNLEAIRRFKAAGGLFSIATGRIHMSLDTCLPNADELVNAPIIVCNGAFLYDLKAQKALCESFIEPELITRAVNCIYELLPDANVRLSVTDGYMTREPIGPLMIRDFNTCPPDKRIIAPIEEWPHHPCYKIVIVDLPERISYLQTEFTKKMGELLECSVSGPRFFELQRKGCTKARLLPELRRICGSARPDKKLKIYAVGDYDNDIEMLKQADVAVCPANALDEVKRIADMTLCSNSEGVIADLIEHIEAE